MLQGRERLQRLTWVQLLRYQSVLGYLRKTNYAVQLTLKNFSGGSSLLAATLSKKMESISFSGLIQILQTMQPG